MKKFVLLFALVATLGAFAALTAPATKAMTGNDASSYLCWNHQMVNPVAYTDSVADVMWATGDYIEPQAILGNVVDGTNIGAYHLVCNAPTTMQKTALGLGGSGEVYDITALTAYNAGHPVNGNDLNVYHIYEVTPGGGNG